MVPLGAFQEEQMDTEQLGSACVVGHWAHSSPEEFVALKSMVQDMVEDTSYFLVLRGG